MTIPDFIASVGVLILLVGFMLNLYKKLSAESKTYAWLNFVGAGLCGYSSYMIKFYPFVLLECVWALVALISIIKVSRGTSK